MTGPTAPDLSQSPSRPDLRNRLPTSRRARPTLRRLALAACLAGLAPLVPLGASARDVPYDQTEQELSSLLAEARDAYDNLDLIQAEGSLYHALSIASSRNYTGRIKAEIHLLRGIIFFARDRDEKATTEEFVKALSADRNIRLDAEMSSPRLEACFDAALQSVNKGDACDAPGTRLRFDEHITHKPPRRTNARRPLKLQATVTPLLRGRISTFYVYFRTDRSEGVRRVAMEDKGNNVYAAKLAGKYIVGKVVRYYMIVDDREGNHIAQYMSVQSPASVEIDDLPTGESLGGESDDEDRSDEGADREPPPSEARSDDPEEPAAEEKDENEEASGGGLDDAGPRHRGAVRFGLSLGTGAGRVTERSIPQTRKRAAVAEGLAPAPFHTLAELDYWFAPSMAVGLYARLQLVDLTHLEGVRLKYEAAASRTSHFVLRGGFGYGHISHQVPLKQYRDYTLEGPFEYSLGFAWVRDFGKTWSLIFAPDFHHLFGTAPSQHLDLNLGAQVTF